MLTISNLFEEPKCQKLSFDSELFRLDGNIDEYEFFREFDESTGYKELVIKERQNNVKD